MKKSNLELAWAKALDTYLMIPLGDPRQEAAWIEVSKAYRAYIDANTPRTGDSK